MMKEMKNETAHELSDNELDAVAGGVFGEYTICCPVCGGTRCFMVQWNNPSEPLRGFGAFKYHCVDCDTVTEPDKMVYRQK